MLARTLALWLMCVLPVYAQNIPNPAMNEPDRVAWELFAKVMTPAADGRAAFESWASDTDTFNANPSFPTVAGPVRLRAPAVPAAGRARLQEIGLVPAVPPNPLVGEETRRNLTAFQFIVANKLHLRSGLAAMYGKPVTFPVDAIEVKANWIPVSKVPEFTNNRVPASNVTSQYYVSRGSDGRDYAMVAVHLISKLVPNWTWATFEHQYNPGRCDILGCKDSFGAVVASVPPAQQPDLGYQPCSKTPAAAALLSSAKVPSVFSNYCLKGSQSDFVDSEGLAIRLGNSVTENGFVHQSSCMTCHGRAAWDATGRATSGAGFDSHGAPMGAINAAWFWSFSQNPPVPQGAPGLTRIATSADFVWSIPFCAIDDSTNPPKASPCVGK